MNWFEYRRFLLAQLRFRKDQQNSDVFSVVSVGYPAEWDDFSTRNSVASLPNSDSTGSRSFNWSGVGEMYKQSLVRNSADAVKAVGGAGFIEGTARSSAHRTYLYRRLPTVMAVTGAYRQYRFALTAFDDITSGQFPGTDESFFV